MTLAETQVTPKDMATDTDDHAHAAHDKSFTKTEAMLLVTVLFVLIAWGLSVFTWGVPGLYIPALAMVPVMYVVLILITRG